jgi:cytochrome c oxidase assembly protein subunit 11
MIAPRIVPRHGRTLVMLVGVASGMAAMAWAAVPLYDLFCRVTGYSGRPLVASTGADRILDETVSVRFAASTAAGMPWAFRPVQNTLDVHPGETNLAFFEASNPTGRPITGHATFNVTPPIVGGYFVKIDCFCFTEQTLAPGETVSMPVTFFVDPAIAEDAETRGVRTITLSYTFFESETETGPDPAAPDPAADARAGLATTPAGG